jgi:hypothetical protein
LWLPRFSDRDRSFFQKTCVKIRLIKGGEPI